VLYRLSYASEVGERWARGELAWKDSRHPTEIGERDHRTKEPDLASLFGLRNKKGTSPDSPPLRFVVRGGTREDANG
jgi:hypothetical protein